MYSNNYFMHAGSHKYIARTGTPGNYKYYYTQAELDASKRDSRGMPTERKHIKSNGNSVIKDRGKSVQQARTDAINAGIAKKKTYSQKQLIKADGKYYYGTKDEVESSRRAMEDAKNRDAAVNKYRDARENRERLQATLGKTKATQERINSLGKAEENMKKLRAQSYAEGSKNLAPERMVTSLNKAANSYEKTNIPKTPVQKALRKMKNVANTIDGVSSNEEAVTQFDNVQAYYHGTGKERAMYELGKTKLKYKRKIATAIKKTKMRKL